MTAPGDIAAFRLALGRLLDAALSAGLEPDLVLEVQAKARELTAELAERRDTRRPSTRQLCERIAHLERQLRNRDAGERVAAILARTGLSRSRYYELRKRALSPETGPDSKPVASLSSAHGAR